MGVVAVAGNPNGDALERLVELVGEREIPAGVRHGQHGLLHRHVVVIVSQ